MANSPFFTDATTIASVSAVAALLNSGYLEIYNGTQPTDANTAIGAQVLLSGGMQFSSTADTNAAATGTATWFRAYKSDGVTGVMDGSVGTSGADLNLNTTSIVQHATVSCTAFSITQLE